MSQIVYKSYVTFAVMGKEINLTVENLGNTWNAVAEIDEAFYYLGNEPATIGTAIFAWQQMNGRELTNEEFRQVLVDNHLLSEAV